MSNHANDQYLETRVMSASPVELVGMLYEAARQAVREARRHLAAGEIAARARQITRVVDIVAELAGALDPDAGGEITQRLAALYDYIGRRLLDANLRQADEPLAEVDGLLATLEEGWAGVAAAAVPASVPDRVPEVRESGCAAGYGAFLTAPEYAMASQSWSA